MALNAVKRDIPSNIEGYGSTDGKLFGGAFARKPEGCRAGAAIRSRGPNDGGKFLGSIRDAIAASGLASGMTISFHHHLRNGDFIVNQVLDECAKAGIRDLTIFPTALFDVHRALIPHIQSGVIRRIMGSVNGPIGQLVSEGELAAPVVLRSHGGRPRAVISGDVRIDVAFIAAPTADIGGNMSGRAGKSACGSLGYAFTDAEYADCVVALTDNLQHYPIAPISIPGIYVDFVVQVGSIGDPDGIVSGTTRVTRDPLRLLIARHASKLIEASPFFQDGLSFQTGAGGIPLAVTAFMKEAMKRRHVRGGFGLGGITGYFVDLLKEGMLKKLMDVQSFDREAVESISSDPRHIEISADWYANPWNCGAAVNQLDVVILGATEVDMDFNANVNTESDGALLHGIGGHQDTAAGAKLTIIAQPLLRGRIPCVVDRVHTVTTPGEVIDAIVTEFGVTINPRRKNLIDACKEAKGKDAVHLVPLDELAERARRMSGPMAPVRQKDRVVGVVEWRDGTVIDVVRQIFPENISS
ncbi:MAG: citrate lyase subunit alpha [Synergistaceae bacterium]|jgi:citrate lyase subunit alpha/citrate CoA-transferase|nr:citrate lyase subunit alpha [Synergistaceae bacterium]